MTPLRVATIGAGYFSQFHHDAWARLEQARLVAVCDRDIARAKAMAARFGGGGAYDDPTTMLDAEKPDLVDIIAPPSEHLALIRLAAARGINTICQKAFCRDLTEATIAAQIAEDTRILLVVHENFRFQPWYEIIKQHIATGALGEVYQITFRLRPGDGQGPNAYLDRQPYFQTLERFLLHETAIHFVDTFRYLLGEYRHVFADLRRLNPVISGEDAGLLIFEHANGARSLFDGNRLVDHAAADRRLTMGEMLVEGSSAVLRLDGYGSLYLRRVGDTKEREIVFAWDKEGFAGDSVLRLQRHVVESIRSGATPVNTARDYLRCLEIEAALYQSATDRAVKPV